jgi:hypothetical protein
MVTNLVRHGLISFVAALVLGVAISVATLTHKTLLDSTPILIVVPRRMMKIFGLIAVTALKFTLPSVNET